MLKKAYCEEFVGKYSVAIRVAIALDLVKKYKYTQLRAARSVQISQPLLNYVIQGRRKPRLLSTVLDNSELRSLIEDFAEQIAGGKAFSMCDFCKAAKNILDRTIVNCKS